MANFSEKRKGYDKDEVNSYISKMKYEYEQKLSEQKERIFSLLDEIKEKDKNLNSFKDKDAQISKALIQAVETSNEMEESAALSYDGEIQAIRVFRTKLEQYLELLRKKYPLDQNLMQAYEFNYSLDKVLNTDNNDKDKVNKIKININNGIEALKNNKQVNVIDDNNKNESKKESTSMFAAFTSNNEQETSTALSFGTNSNSNSDTLHTIDGGIFSMFVNEQTRVDNDHEKEVDSKENNLFSPDSESIKNAFNPKEKVKYEPKPGSYLSSTGESFTNIEDDQKNEESLEEDNSFQYSFIEQEQEENFETNKLTETNIDQIEENETLKEDNAFQYSFLQETEESTENKDLNIDDNQVEDLDQEKVEDNNFVSIDNIEDIVDKDQNQFNSEDNQEAFQEEQVASFVEPADDQKANEEIDVSETTENVSISQNIIDNEDSSDKLTTEEILATMDLEDVKVDVTYPDIFTETITFEDITKECGNIEENNEYSNITEDTSFNGYEALNTEESQVSQESIDNKNTIEMIEDLEEFAEDLQDDLDNIQNSDIPKETEEYIENQKTMEMIEDLEEVVEDLQDDYKEITNSASDNTTVNDNFYLNDGAELGGSYLAGVEGDFTGFATTNEYVEEEEIQESQVTSENYSEYITDEEVQDIVEDEKLLAAMDEIADVAEELENNEKLNQTQPVLKYTFANDYKKEQVNNNINLEQKEENENLNSTDYEKYEGDKIDSYFNEGIDISQENTNQRETLNKDSKMNNFPNESLNNDMYNDDNDYYFMRLEDEKTTVTQVTSEKTLNHIEDSAFDLDEVLHPKEELDLDELCRELGLKD